MPVASPLPRRARVLDERAARRDLCDQIARLERELARTLADVFPRREPARDGRSASAQAGPRLLTLGQLERIRDELADRVADAARAPRAGAARGDAARARAPPLGDRDERRARRAGLHGVAGAPPPRPDRHADGVVAREDLLRLPVTPGDSLMGRRSRKRGGDAGARAARRRAAAPAPRRGATSARARRGTRSRSSSCAC